MTAHEARYALRSWARQRNGTALAMSEGKRALKLLVAGVTGLVLAISVAILCHWQPGSGL